MQQICPAYQDSCATVIQQTVDVGLPISLVPFVDLGNIQILCTDQPTVVCCSCADGAGGLALTVTQTLTYRIPLAYRAEATAGDITTACKQSPPCAGCMPWRV